MKTVAFCEFCVRARKSKIRAAKQLVFTKNRTVARRGRTFCLDAFKKMNKKLFKELKSVCQTDSIDG